MNTVREHLRPVVGPQAYPPSLRSEHPAGEGTPGETEGSDRSSRILLLGLRAKARYGQAITPKSWPLYREAEESD